MTAKILVLGTAHNHVLGIAKSIPDARDCELIGVWDENPDRRANAAEKLATRPFDSLEEALKTGPDLALLGAVPRDRAGLARKVVAAGGAVLADKPLAVTHEELDRTIEAVEKCDRPVITYYPFRGLPSVVAARQALEAGRIGRLVRILSSGPHQLRAASRPDWHWTRADNGGCIIDVGSHHVDMACHISGESPRYVCCLHTNIGHPEHPGFQNFAQAHLHFPSGVIGQVEADWCAPASMKHFGDTRLWIVGTTGKIEIREGDVKTAEIWTQTEAMQPLATQGLPDTGQWTAALIEDLGHGRPGPIRQSDVWRASKITLHAFDSAEAGGKPIELS